MTQYRAQESDKGDRIGVRNNVRWGQDQGMEGGAVMGKGGKVCRSGIGRREGVNVGCEKGRADGGRGVGVKT